MQSAPRLTAAHALAGAGLALFAAALLRTHALLAGLDPAPGSLIAAGVVGGIALGRRWSRPKRTWALAGALAIALVTVLAPLLLSRLSGWPAAIASMALAFMPAMLVGAGLPRIVAPSSLACAGLGAAVAALGLLPWTGPTVTALVGAALVAAAAVIGGAAELAATQWERARVSQVVQGLGIGLLLPAVVWCATTTWPWRWPLAILAAGIASLGLALGLRFAGTRAEELVCVLALFVPFLASVLDVDERIVGLIDTFPLPTVGPAGGLVVLVLASLPLCLPFGVLAGVTCARVPSLLAVTVGLVGASLGGMLGSSHEAIAVVGLALCFGTGCVLPLVEDASRSRRLVGAALALGAVITLVLSFPKLIAPRTEFASGLRATRVDVGDEEPERERQVLVNGALVASDALPRLYDDLLAGHLAALVPEHAKTVVLVGSGSSRVLEALAAHGITDVEVHEPSRALRKLALTQVQGARVSPSPAGWAHGPLADAIIVQVDDPTLPAFEAFFTRQAHEATRARLAPGGVLVQRLSLDRLGPQGLLRHVLLMQQVFPRVHLMSADRGRAGAVLVVASTADAPGLPLSRLWLDPAWNARMTEPVRASLHRALMLQSLDLLDTVAAGPREIAAIADVAAHDAWREADLALRQGAPELVARSVARGMLFSRIVTVDVDLELPPSAADEVVQRHPFFGLATALPAPWSAAKGVLRYQNRFVPVLDEWGLYREASTQLVMERPGGTLVVTEIARSRASTLTLDDSLRGLWSEAADRAGMTFVNGHEARWLFAQPTLDEQVVIVTWHCPLQAKLFAARLSIADGKPGMHEEPLELVATRIRCDHFGPPPSSAPPVADAATGSAP